jgi:hypothetical protein
VSSRVHALAIRTTCAPIRPSRAGQRHARQHEQMTSLALVRIDLTRRSESQESWKGAHSLALFERTSQHVWAGTPIGAGNRRPPRMSREPKSELLRITSRRVHDGNRDGNRAARIVAGGRLAMGEPRGPRNTEQRRLAYSLCSRRPCRVAPRPARAGRLGVRIDRRRASRGAQRVRACVTWRARAAGRFPP